MGHADADVRFEMELELPADPSDDGDDDESLLFVVEASISPGFAGSYSYNAASDIDYYGEAPGVEDILVVLVKDPETGKTREPSKEERVAFDRWVDSHPTQFNDLAVSEWDGGSKDYDPYDDDSGDYCDDY